MQEVGMAKLRVVHYLNQFFAGVGGEEKADARPASKDGPVGPGAALKMALGEVGEVVGTVYCGDNRMAQHAGEATGKVVELIGQFKPDVVVAGPAFGSGRYGLACGQVCTAVQESLKVPAVTGVHRDSPAAAVYRGKALMASTSETTAGMTDAMSVMASLAVKLTGNENLGPANDDGYLPTGRRENEFSEKTAAERAVQMLLGKLKGEAPNTEWPLPRYDRVAPAPPIENPGKATIALITEGGIVQRGNPEKLESSWASKWLKFDIAQESSMTSEKYQSIHGGYDTTAASAEPNRVVPLDVARDLEKERAIGGLHDYIYSTTGNMGPLVSFRKFGQEMAAELWAAGVQGIILTAT
jgi:glycine reductase